MMHRKKSSELFLGLGFGWPLHLLVQHELDQLFNPGRLRVQADLLSTGQPRDDFGVRAVWSLWHQFDAPQTFWGDDPRLHLHTLAVAVVLPVDWGHPISEDEECPEHHNYAQLHVSTDVSIIQ